MGTGSLGRRGLGGRTQPMEVNMTEDAEQLLPDCNDRSLTSPHLQSPFCHECNTFTGPRSQGVALSGGHCSADCTHVQRFTFQTGKGPMATPIALAMPWQQLSGGSAVDTIYPNYLKIDLLSYQFFSSLLSPPQCKQHPSAWATAWALLCSPLKLHST